MREGVDFPGWKAALPVLATAVLLHTGQAGGSYCSRLLSLRPLVWVGLISYSLYLWHWPLLIFARYGQGMAALPLAQALGLLVLAVALSAITYRVIEQPLRYWRKADGAAAQPRVFMASAFGAVVLLAVAGGLMVSKGLPARVPAKVLALDQARLPVVPYKQCDGKPVSLARTECRIGAPGNDNLTLVWGDSWAMAWAPALDAVLKQQGRAGVLALRSSCAPLLGVRNLKSPPCQKRNDEVMAWIKQHRPARVMLIAVWPTWASDGDYPLQDMSGAIGNKRIFEQAYPRTLRALHAQVKDIIVLAPTPGASDYLPFRMALVQWHGGKAPIAVTPSEFTAYVQDFRGVTGKPLVGETIIDPAPWFCDSQHCRFQDNQGHLLYRDSHHLSLAGANFVAKRLAVELPR
jgi:hypothetical protein